MEPPVRALGDPLAREHARRFLAAAPVGIDAGRVRPGARQVVLQQEAQEVAPVRVLGQRQLRHAQMAQRGDVVVAGDLAAAHRVAVPVRPRGVDALGPLLQEFRSFGADLGQRFLVAQAQAQAGFVGVRCRLERRRRVRGKRLGTFRVFEFRQRPVAGVRSRSCRRATLRVSLGLPAGLRDLGQVAAAVVRDQHRRARFPLLDVHVGRPAGLVQAQPLPQQPAHVPEHPVDAGVLELAGDRRVDGHVLVGGPERQPVSAPLLADVAQRVRPAAAIELVQHDDVGEVEHVDLLELAGRAVVRGHHIDREVDQIDDLAVALPDAGGLHQDHVEA